MARGGYVKLFRSIEGWEWYSDGNTFRVFLHLLLNANHSAARWQGIALNPGQKITSIEKIAEELKLSRQNVRTALNHLKSTNEITVQSTNKYILVTVANWAFYQCEDYESTSKLTDCLTFDQPTANQQLTTNKKNKKNKNEKNINGVDFESFWEAYPKRTEKQAASKCWEARIKEGYAPEDMIAAANAYAVDCRNKDPQFIKMARTFLGPNKPFVDYMAAVTPPASDDLPDFATEPSTYLVEFISNRSKQNG